MDDTPVLARLHGIVAGVDSILLVVDLEGVAGVDDLECLVAGSSGFAAAITRAAAPFGLTTENRASALKFLRLATLSVVLSTAIWASMVISLDLAFNERSQIAMRATAPR